MPDIRELYARRLEAASIALERGDREEAERLYSEALAMGEENFGANEPTLAVPLNELSRLYVRGSEHARAEPLLKRLLDIRRATGEQHSDVATVLAALAAVRRGLNDDVGAEGLYRQALEIREKVHAPDHMSVVVTLEHLGDTCAALRKFGEATTLFHRALTTREKVLGTNHQTVRSLRERIANLAVKSAPTPPAAPRPLPPPPAAPAPEPLRVSGELVFLYEPEKPVRRASVKRDRVMTPPFSAAVAAASLITSPAHAAPPAREPAPAQTSAPLLPIADLNAFDAAIMPRTAEQVAPAAAPRRSQRVASPARDGALAPKKAKKGKGVVFATGGLLALASAGFLVSSRPLARSASETPAAARVAELVASRTPAHAATAAAAVAAPTRLSAQRSDSSRVASVTPLPVAAPTSPAVHTAQHSDAQGGSHLAAASLAALPTIGSVNITETKAPNADSVLRATTTRRDTDNEPVVSAPRLRAVALGEDHAETSPVLIGTVPQPRFPDALRAQGVGGDVVVQFLVAADGSVEASTMKVVRSPHELFTAAVRNVLPRFKFQPARSADGKARAETVQYSIQFSATK